MELEERMCRVEKKLIDIDKKLDTFLSEYAQINKYKINECEKYFRSVFVTHENIPNIKQDFFKELEEKELVKINVANRKSGTVRNILEIFKIIIPWIVLILVLIMN